MAPMVRAVGLTKTFGRTRALAGLDLSVDGGEVHGFLGPNGAGKSTTLRVLLGLLRADGGDVSVLGRDPWRDAVEVHRDVAYVPGDVSLWSTLSGGETIDLLTAARGGADPQLRERLLRDFALEPRTRGRAYSKGNRQKVALVAAFARPAALYLFDEPTSGLDPLMEEVFRREVQRVRADGAAVLLSSHILSEVEQLCDRVTIVRDGLTVETGRLADLRHVRRNTFRVLTPTGDQQIGRVTGVHDVRREGEQLVFDAEADAVPAVLAALSEAGATGLTVAPPSLEQLFLRHYWTPTGATQDRGPNREGGPTQEREQGQGHRQRQAPG